MQDKDALVASAQIELDDAKQLLQKSAADNKELQARIQEVRGEVAGEMALMTSTMMREKEVLHLGTTDNWLDHGRLL